MVRWTMGAVLVAVLGCSGLVPPMETVERGAVTLDLVRGTVETDLDRGADGDYDVARVGLTQALSWGPLDEDFELDRHSQDLQQAMELILARQGLSFGEVARSETWVDGRPAVGFRTEVDGETLLSTSWRCDEAGVHVTLNSTGAWGTEEAHTHSLVSARCGETALSLEQVPTHRHTGDWEPGEATGGTIWVRPDGQAWLFAMDSAAMGDVGIEACGAALQLVLTNQGLLDVPDPEVAVWPRPGGCLALYDGVDEGRPVAGWIEHRTCGEVGYVGICAVPEGESARAVCEGRLTCP